MAGIGMGRCGPRGSRGKKAVHRQVLNVGYLPDCGQKEPACSTVFDWVRSFASGKATAQAVRGVEHRYRMVPRRYPEACMEMAATCMGTY